MSACACMLVKNEVDVISWTLDVLARHVDEIVVADNGSIDGTLEAIEAAGLQPRDTEGYNYSPIISGLAREAFENGHDWVIPIDADEVWQTTDLSRLGSWLDSLPDDIQLVHGAHRNYLPTAADDAGDPNPLTRIRWRLEDWGWAKVACRTRPDLVISHGAHAATPPGKMASESITVRHFSWRSVEQCVTKNRRGIEAYKNTKGLKDNDDEHWRRWEGFSDEDIAAYFYREYWADDPENDTRFVYDPVTL